MYEAAGRVLALHVGEHSNGWGVVAIEAPAGELSAEQAFADHAHNMIGSFPTLLAAVLAAERFASKWKPATSAPCACAEIKTKPLRHIDLSARPVSRLATKLMATASDTKPATRRGPEERAGRGSPSDTRGLGQSPRGQR